MNNRLDVFVAFDLNHTWSQKFVQT
jgi:hypothetical protein